MILRTVGLDDRHFVLDVASAVYVETQSRKLNNAYANQRCSFDRMGSHHQTNKFVLISLVKIQNWMLIEVIQIRGFGLMKQRDNCL